MEVLRRLFGQQGEALHQVDTTENNAVGDRSVLDELDRQGADLSRPREARHYLYFRDHENAILAGHRLHEDGFSTQVSRAAGDGSWLLLASHTALLNSETVPLLRHRLTGVASSLGGDYDGWEASPEP
jgi:hypothetical protein